MPFCCRKHPFVMDAGFCFLLAIRGSISISSVASTTQNLCKRKCKGHVCSIINSVPAERCDLKTQDEEVLNGVKVRI